MPRRKWCWPLAAGAQAIADLLVVPGASRTLLEAAVPYSQAAMVAWLGGRPDQFCSSTTARAMAVAALVRREYAPAAASLAGVAGHGQPGDRPAQAGPASPARRLANHRPHRLVLR